MGYALQVWGHAHWNNHTKRARTGSLKTVKSFEVETHSFKFTEHQFQSYDK